MYPDPRQGPGAPTPGWYPDPSGAPGSRYWDGSAWAPPPSARQPNRRGWLIAAVCALVLILLLVLWGMRPDRQGQPGQPGQPAQRSGAAAHSLVLDVPLTSPPTENDEVG